MTEPERPADPEEQRAAAALAEALDRGDLPGDAADADVVDAAALLTAHDRFELSADRMDAVAARIAARAPAASPRRRWRWLWIAASTLAAAAALALVVLPANAPREAADSAPSAASVEPSITPALVAPAPAPDAPAPPAALIALQQRMISGDATAEVDYRAALARHRARLIDPGQDGP